jgi:hypothetical protein
LYVPMSQLFGCSESPRLYVTLQGKNSSLNG